MRRGRDRRPRWFSVVILAFVAAAASPASAAVFTWLLPSSARWPGMGNAFFRTDLFVTNRDTRQTTVTLKFLRHDEDGTFGPEVPFTLGSGEALTLADVLSRVFGFTLDWGAIQVSADTPLLDVTSQTWTSAGSAGTYGQSVPGFPPSMLVLSGAPRTIPAIRQDALQRTNLVLANAIGDQIIVHGELFDAAGTRLGQGRDWVLPPFGMTQATAVVEEFLGPGAELGDGRLLLSTSMPDARFAAYASIIDARTNDPRAVLPPAGLEPGMTWMLPSSAHAAGAGGAFYTTQLTLANPGATDAAVTIRFLGHDTDGSLAPQRELTVRAGATTLLPDVLGGIFGVSSGYGALLVTASSPSLAVIGETSTPAPGGGTFGQSVPGVPAAAFIRPGSSRWLGGIREDASFRTNVMLANPTAVPVTVHAELSTEGAVLLGTRDWTLPPYGMTQVDRVVTALVPGATLAGGQLVLSTPTGGGAFAAYASVIDDTTNDPRTILPQ